MGTNFGKYGSRYETQGKAGKVEIAKGFVRCCGCLVAGGPTACVRCAKAGE